MRAALLALALLAGPAAADDIPSFAWGFPLTDAGQNTLAIERCEEGCWARVTYRNTYIRYGRFGEPDDTFTLRLDGMDVVVTILVAEDLGPEVLTLEPPPGFMVEPREVTVPEDASGEVRLVPVPMS